VVFIVIKSLLVLCDKIFVLANTIAPAIKILRIMRELDIKSDIENWEIDHRLLEDKRKAIDRGTEIISHDMVNHQ
jgi:hypothetical protein